jgi:nitrous oxidase accessory protein NosD
MPVKDAMTNLPRYVALALALAAGFPALAAESGKTWTVSPGQSIQEAVDQAAPGDTVQVLPGEYAQSVEIKKDGITLKGLEYENERTTLKAKDAEENEPLPCGIRVSGNDTTVSGLIIDGFSDAGIDISQGERIAVRDVLIRDTAEFGLRAKGVRSLTLDRVVAGGMRTRAIAISASSEVTVLRSEAFSSGVGLAIGDSQQVLVDDSSFHHNGTGIVIGSDTSEETKAGSYAKIIRCRIMGNEKPPKGIGEGMPPGIGIFVYGATHTDISHNVIAYNGSIGIATMARQEAPVRHLPADAARPGPLAEHTYVNHNTYYGNGAAPSAEFKKQFEGIPPGDLYWDGLGERNQWQENTELRTYPEKLVVKQGGVHTKVIHFQ